MSVTSTVANKLKYLMATKKIDFENDTFKICLMDTGYSFDKDAHHYYSDISASEIADGSGYTTGGATLSGVTVTENDTDDRTDVAWSTDPSWTASGGSIAAIGAIVYDDTETNKAIVGYIDFGATQTAVNTKMLTVSTVVFRVA